MTNPMTFPSTNEELMIHETVFAPGLLDRKVVFVSGGGSGIGRATAWLAARLGANVVVGGRTEEKLLKVRDSINSQDGLSAYHQTLDVRNREQVEAAFDEVYRVHGGIDILVNSAGGQFPQPSIDYTEKGWHSVINTNLHGTWNMMDVAAKRWKKAGEPGSIVNIVVVGQGLHGVAHTAAARAGVVTFSEKASVEWAPLNIRVNCIAPGAIQTEGWAVYSESARSLYPRTNPLMRAGSPWEIAEAVVFIAGPGGKFINGETLVVDGGGQHWGEIWTTNKPDYYVEASRLWDSSKEGDE
jgi:citronellol/citronellal dehydrogenase